VSVVQEGARQDLARVGGEGMRVAAALAIISPAPAVSVARHRAIAGCRGGGYVPLVSMSRPGRVAGGGRRFAGGVWLKAPQKCLAAELGSRDGWGGCDVRWSIVLVETVILGWAAAVVWAGERGGSGGRALRRCYDRSLSSGMLGVTSPPGTSGRRRGCEETAG
jgi:hypothetical protein